jgi:putative SOS response-associated peptidase YedK
MCGRYTLRAKPAAVAEEFDLPEVPSLTPRFNVAPTQAVAVVRLAPEENGRRLDALRWGLVPFWADDPGIGNRMINARADTVATKPAFRHAFKPLSTCTIITTNANDLMTPIHERMPVIIPRSAYELWLDPAIKDSERLTPLLVPYADDQLEAYPVTKRVNDPSNDVPECVVPLRALG